MSSFLYFLKLNTIPLCTYHLLLIHSSISVYLGCFNGSAISNRAAMGVPISLQDSAFSSSGYICGSGIAESYGNSILNFFWNCRTVFHCGSTILHSQCLHVLANIYFLFVFDSSHPNECEVVAHYGSDCISLIMLSIFSCVYWSFVHLSKDFLMCDCLLW